MQFQQSDPSNFFYRHSNKRPNFQIQTFIQIGFWLKTPMKDNKDLIVGYVNSLLTADDNEKTKILDLLIQHREKSINYLPDLLWKTPGVMTLLLVEVISIYPYIATNNSNPALSNRVCNILALFQCICQNDSTRKEFIDSNILMYLFPFLHNTSSSNSSKEIEYLKITSLGIIGVLVKADEECVVEYLLKIEYVPLFLRILRFGSEISKIISAFIIHKILKFGSESLFKEQDKVEIILKVLNIAVLELIKKPFNGRLSNHICNSYSVLLDPRYDLKAKISTSITSDLYDYLNKSKVEDNSFKELVKNLIEIKDSAGSN